MVYTMANVITGKLLHLSPEAIGSPNLVDARSDLYSVGAMGYYLLSGKNLFDGSLTVEICFQDMKKQPRPMSKLASMAISPNVENSITKCLNKDPTSRPRSARELVNALK